MMRKDILAAGFRTAQFAAGDNNTGDAELKNLSSEPREDVAPVEIDRTRRVKRIQPKGEYILVQRREPENISAGGLFIPEAVKEQDRPAEGVVLAVGYNVRMLSVGNHIIFGKYAGTEYPWGTESLLFMREEEVIATVEE
jgi:chaperonin GroES